MGENISRRQLLQTGGTGIGGLLLGEYGLTAGRSDLLGTDQMSSEFRSKAPPLVSSWTTELQADYAYVSGVSGDIVSVTRYDGQISALERASGALIGTVEFSNEGWPSPSIESGVVYDVSENRLSVVDTTASTTWTRTHALDSVWVEVDDTHLFAVGNSTVRAFDRATGRDAFTHTTESSDISVEFGSHTVRIQAEENVILSSDTGDQIYVSETGFDTENFSIQEPSSDTDDVIWIYDDETILSLSLTGSIHHRQIVPDTTLVTSTDQGFILVRNEFTPSERTIDLVDPATGQTVWSVDAGAGYVDSFRGLLYADGSTAGFVDLDAGSIAWERGFENDISALAMQYLGYDDTHPSAYMTLSHSTGSRLVTVDQTSGVQRWSVELDDSVHSLSVIHRLPDTVYLGINDNIVRFQFVGETQVSTRFRVEPSTYLAVEEHGSYVYFESDSSVIIADKTGTVIKSFETGMVADYGSPTVIETDTALLGYEPGAGIQWQRTSLTPSSFGTDIFGERIAITRPDSSRIQILDRETGEIRANFDGELISIYNDGRTGPSAVRAVRETNALHVFRPGGRVEHLKFDTADSIEEVFLFNGTLLVSTTTTVAAYDVVDFSRRWRESVPESGEVVVIDGRCYLHGESLRCVRIHDGTPLWAHHTDGGFLEAWVDDNAGAFLGGSEGIVNVASPATQVESLFQTCRKLRSQIVQTRFQVPTQSALSSAAKAQYAGQYLTAQVSLSVAYRELRYAISVIDHWHELNSETTLVTTISRSTGSLDAAEQAMEQGEYETAATLLAQAHETQNLIGTGVVIGAGLLGAALGYFAPSGGADETANKDGAESDSDEKEETEPSPSRSERN